MKVYTVKKARKDIPSTDIKAGDTYYWWKFKRGGKRVSKTYPKPQQLTQSDFYISVYDINDRIAELSAETHDDLQSEVESIVDDIRNLASETEDKLSNMPEGLQQGPTGELLQERIDAVNQWADDIEAIDLSDEDTTIEDLIDEVSQCECSV